MAYKTKHLHISNKTRVQVKLGLKTMQITLHIPLRQVASQVVKAAFGSKASVTNGRKG